MAKKKRRDWGKIKIPMIVVYTVIAVVFNCWVLTTFFTRAAGPTVVAGTVADTDTGAPLKGATVGMRMPPAQGSKEITVATNAEGRYKLVIPGSYDNYQLFCLYGGTNGVIVNAPLKPLTGPPKEGESKFQIILHRDNTVDWEVSTR